MVDDRQRRSQGSRTMTLTIQRYLALFRGMGACLYTVLRNSRSITG
jgi:hypothetical protein